MARAGGKDARAGSATRSRAARELIAAALAVKVLALDYGSARTGVAVSDPTGTLARPRRRRRARRDARRASSGCST